MITVTIFKEDDVIKGFKASGHAGYADAGEDIVCAAVSVLYINTINSLIRLTGDLADIKGGDDNINVSVFIKSPSKEAELLLKSFEIGINSVAEEYGDFLKVVYQN